MADSGQVKALIGGLEGDIKKALTQVFEYVLVDIRVGLPGHLRRSTNLRWVQLDGVTSSTPGQEFTVAHGLRRIPAVIFPALDVSGVNRTMPDLTVSRAADANRLYFTSTVGNASFTIFVE